jgi:hypothetical protein
MANNKLIYFTRHDADLQSAIASVKKGEQNLEIRKALRFWFLGELPNTELPSPVESLLCSEGSSKSSIENNHKHKDTDILNDLALPTDLLR